MDEFGVFTERYGLKPQGKSAPMAASRRSANTQAQGFGISSSPNSKSSSASHSNSNSIYGSYLDDLKGPFQSTAKSHSFGSLNGDSDLFGVCHTTAKQSNNGFDFDSMLMGSSNSGSGYVDDIFGGTPGMKIPVSSNKEGVYSSTSTSPTKNNDPFDDSLKSGKHRNSKSFNQNGSTGMVGPETTVELDDLLAGFGGISTDNGVKNTANGIHKSSIHSTKTVNVSSEDPFVMLEKSASHGFTSSVFSLDTLEQIPKSGNSEGASVSTSNPSSVLRPPPKPRDKIKLDNGSAASSIDELEKFATAHVESNAVKSSQFGTNKTVPNSETKINKNKEGDTSAGKNQPNGVYDFDSFLSVSSRSSSLRKTRNPTSEFDAKKPSRTSSGVAHEAPAAFPESMKSSASFDDLSFIFGGSPSVGVFEEFEGETEERRKARFQRHKMTQARMAKALADMNQRDFQSQQEQEERLRISDIVDADIKRWAAGKEGNMRALLSTMQYVLWPECAWQPVSLTDIITSASVKKVYKKATLCVHPDKVQQKGASLRQRYTAEKVFDILKEAWTKFSAEELS